MADQPRTKRARVGADSSAAATEAPPAIRLENESFRRASKAHQKLADLWRKGCLCDVDVVVEGQTFSAHRIVLSAGSDYMSALLCEDRFKDSTGDRIDIVDMSATAFGLFLEWTYEGRCIVNEAEVGLTDLLEAASRLQCADLIDRTEKEITARLDAENCLSVWDAADRLHLTNLANSAEAKALMVYRDLVGTEAFQALPAAKLSKLLSSDDLCMPIEEEVFKSVLDWVRSKARPPPKAVLGDIFDNVRFALMPEKFVTSHVETNSLVTGNPKAMHSLYSSMRDSNYNRDTKRTSMRRVPLSWEEIRPGLRVRIMNDIEVVKERFSEMPPGAAEKAAEWRDHMASFIGKEVTVLDLFEEDRCVVGDGYLWPFTVLLHAKQQQ